MFDYRFRHGLVFGLEHEALLALDGEDGFVVSSISLHLGFFTLTLIYS